MEIAEKDLLYTFLNKHVKVVHKRGDLIFINRGKFLDIDDIFIKIHDVRDNREILIKKEKIDNIDLIEEEDK